LDLLAFVQHVLNLVMFANVFWIAYKTLSMVSYSFLKPFLIFNMIYLITSLVLSGFLVMKLKKKTVSKRQRAVWLLTVICTLVLCVNILYWEFYYQKHHGDNERLIG